MKKLLLLTTGLLFTLISFAQEKVDWKEKEDFHKVMSNVFHSMEKGDYAPLKNRSAELALVANKWKKASIPSSLDAKQLKPLLKQLAANCKAVNKSVKKNADNEILKTKITQAHETFHKIVGLCNHNDE